MVRRRSLAGSDAAVWDKFPFVVIGWQSIVLGGECYSITGSSYRYIYAFCDEAA